MSTRAQGARPAGGALSLGLPPSPVQVLEAITRLAGEAGPAAREEELVEIFVRALARLLPRRALCIRVIDPDSGDLLLLRAEGRLRAVVRMESLRVNHQSFEMVRLQSDLVARGRLALGEGYETIFEDTAGGFALPLAAGGKLFGLLNVETAAGVAGAFALAQQDAEAVLPIANMLAVAFRNARLLDETTFLRDYLAKLIDHANALILVCDRDRKVTVFNRALERLTRFSREEVLGRDPCDWLPVSARGEFARVFADALRGEPVTGFEAQVPTRDGEERRAVFNTAPLSGVEADVEGLIAVGQDLTAIRSLEAQVIQAEKLATDRKSVV